VQYLERTGAEIITGGKRYHEAPLHLGNFVQPTIAVPKTADPTDPIWKTETFAPILNAALFDDLEEAIVWNNAVPQGLSSSLWTRDIRNVGKWIGPAGSDTGIVNVGVECMSVVTSSLIFNCTGQCRNQRGGDRCRVRGKQGAFDFQVELMVSADPASGPFLTEHWLVSVFVLSHL
jgi:acyl-CoA reductase-like NAD-dependent aldehyde dehydrogenase